MRARLATVVTAVAVLAVTATTAVAVTLTVDGPDDRPGVRGGMMSAPWQDRPGDQPGWHRRGPMVSRTPGMVHGPRVDSEHRYLAEMVAHHQEAVDTARQLQRSQRVRMRAFGESIVATQSAQIEQMQEWLADWYPDRSGRVDYQPMMRDLSGLSDDRLDRVFLQDMTMHHMAAVMMSQQMLLGGVAEHREVASLARTIRGEQHAEMFQMQAWLWQWFGHSGRGMHGSGWMGPGMMPHGRMG